LRFLKIFFPFAAALSCGIGVLVLNQAAEMPLKFFLRF
jgi:hypothetical protein